MANTGSQPNLMLAAFVLIVLAAGITLVVLSRVRGTAGPAALLVLLLISAGALLTLNPTAASAADCPPTAPPVGALAGDWQGEVIGDSAPYSLVAHITDDGTTASATVNYDPALACTSTWTQTARVGDTVTMLETVSDPVACADGGVVTLTPDGATLL